MNYDLPISDPKVLHRYQRNVRGREYVKVTCILMLSKGCSAEFISECLGIDCSTVYHYWNLYKTNGLDSFLDNRQKGYWGLLLSHESSLLRSELKHTLYTDSKSKAKWIKDNQGVDYTQGIVDLLNRIGFSYKKTKKVPCECREKKQPSFMEELSEILEYLDEDTVVYYADGVHPTHNSCSAYGRTEKGQGFEQPTVSSRHRVNINGLVNTKNTTDVICVDCENVNAQSTGELCQKALDKHLKAKKVYIISDNAGYYRNRELTEWIRNTSIKQIFLPPYSPDSNLIERLWKFLRKKVINTEFYRTKKLFRKAIHDFFEHIEQYKSELLLILNFRLINSQSFSF